jgi:hypothetical protein
MNTEQQAKVFAYAMFDLQRHDIPQFNNEFDTAIENLIQSGYTAAHFGIMGGFMYCEPETP